MQRGPSGDEAGRLSNTNILQVEQETSDYQPTTDSSNADAGNHGSPESRDTCSLDHDQELNVEPTDMLNENLQRDQRTRATGFVGKSSEVHWLRAAALEQAGRQDEENGGTLPQQRGSYAPGNDQICTFSYWTDGEHIDVDFVVDATELPPPETAERLLQCYISKVQDSFPIFPRKTFEDRFRKYFVALRNGRPLELSARWRAILNLVFAIGSKYSHLTKASWRADECDHLIYQARARFFGLNETTITTHSDLQQVQALALLALYWLSTGQVSRYVLIFSLYI